MAGVDTVRGIGYQQAQAVLEAVALLDDKRAAAALRVEGVEDVIDVEVLDHRAQLLVGKQFKVRADEYTWGQAELVAVMRRWAAAPGAESAVFEFVTDGRLGPSGERVRNALRAAAAGELADLAAVLGADEDAAVVRPLARAVVRQDPVGVGALLLRAERQVMAMLPAPATAADARHEAEAAVNRLFALLMKRAAHPDADQRVVDRAEIADVLGVMADQAAGQRWPGKVRGRYLERAAALALDTVASPLLEPIGGDGAASRVELVGERGRLPVLNMAERVPALLAGRTGEGKSTACRVLVRDAAAKGRVVLLAHAEAYLPGRLVTLAADALSEVLDEPMPAATGAQALADAALTLVIDGVSEVPRALRDALAEDLRAKVASGRGAGVVVVGRDVAALRAVLPASRIPTRFAVAVLDWQHRLDAAHRLVTGAAPPDQQERFPAEVRTLAAQAEHSLGDAAGNPLLFAMAVRLLSEGVSFTDRAGMYAAFVEGLAERAGAEGVAETKRVLGVVFARLLDEGRRYADPYEWRALVADVAAALAADAERVDEAARRSGVVTSIGYAQTVVPMHDSFADYLAGAAHAAGLVPLPARLGQADELRVAFATQICGIDAALAAAIARDLPLLAVSVAEQDVRVLDASAPAEVAALLVSLTGADAPAGVALWRDRARVVAFADNDGGEARWVDDDEARDLAQSTPHVVGSRGPLDLAVRLWRYDLRVRLTPPRALPPGRPQTVDDAVGALRAHTAATVAELGRLMGVLPAAARPAVAAQIGPFGLTARVGQRQQRLRGAEWSMTYTPTDDIDIAAVPGDEQLLDSPDWGSSSVDHALSSPPQAKAAERVRDAINKLVGRMWL